LKKTKKVEKSTHATMLLVVIGAIIFLGIVIAMIQKGRVETRLYELGECLLTYDSVKSHYIGASGEQLIYVTQDGVTAYSNKGQEVWRDTLSLEKVLVEQNGDYFAVASKEGKKISIFGDKGKLGEVNTQYPIVMFAINERGDVALVERMEKGHMVSTYSSKGISLGVKRVSYIDTAGYPLALTLSPSSNQLLISYVNLSGPTLTSDIVALDIKKETQETRDDLLYGIQEKGNLVFGLHFITQDKWVSVGDQNVTFYQATGENIQTLSGVYLKFNPYLNRISKTGGFIPLVITESEPLNTIHNKETLRFLNEKGDTLAVIDLKDDVTSFYADEKGVIIGQSNTYTGYNKLGNPYFKFQGTQDIKKVVPIGNKYIAITKDEVYVLKLKGIEEEI
jgi:hypothetical protein